MRALGALGGLLLVGFVAGACSSGGFPTEQEGVHSTSEAITAACNVFTIGLPCDPDGPAAPLLECEGVCIIGSTGTAECATVAEAGLTNMDGKVCGNAGGVGDTACALHCSGKTCLVKPAPAGAACRPGAANSPCDGQCDGAGSCTPIANACAFGRDAQTCQFETCDFLNATSCMTENVLAGTNCSDGSACQIAQCSSFGQCVVGINKGCDDGNSCTDDSCDPTTGGCIGKPNDANTCSDGNVCTIGDTCSGGTCKPGAGRPNCDDGIVCTADVCDPTIGCYHFQRCEDFNACTDDTCNPQTLACPHTPVNCDDKNPCTADSCDTKLGCQHTPIEMAGCPEIGGAGAGGADGSAGANDGGTTTVGAAGEGLGGTGGTTAIGGSGGDSGSTAQSGGSGGTENGTAGANDSGGSLVVGGDGSTDTKPASNDSSGCGCHTGRSDPSSSSAAFALAALGLAAMRRRRRRR